MKEGNIGSYDENLNREECKRQQATCVASIPTCNITKEEAESKKVEKYFEQFLIHIKSKINF